MGHETGSHSLLSMREGNTEMHNGVHYTFRHETRPCAFLSMKVALRRLAGGADYRKGHSEEPVCICDRAQPSCKRDLNGTSGWHFGVSCLLRLERHVRITWPSRWRYAAIAAARPFRRAESIPAAWRSLANISTGPSLPSRAQAPERRGVTYNAVNLRVVTPLSWHGQRCPG